VKAAAKVFGLDMIKKFFLGAALSTLISAHATSLVGTSVTGQVQYDGSGPNYFDPALGFVPAGVLNVGGTTVAISASAIEFGVADGANVQTADFTVSQLIITDVSSSLAVDFRMTFKNSAFVGATLSEASDTFLNGGATASLSGDTITVNVPGFERVGTFSAVFNIALPSASVPEGGMTISMLGLGLAGLIAKSRRTQYKRTFRAEQGSARL
jgi:hypothetical protein